MSCVEVNPCNDCSPCNPDYTDTGCIDFPKTGCVIYDGDDIECLGIEKTENLNDVLQHIKDVVCALTPTAYEDFDFSCFASEGIETEQQFVEFISTLLCSILGTQTPSTITSLSSLYTLIQSLTTNMNLVRNQTVINCFQSISGLSTPEDLGVLLTAIQTVICDINTRLTAVEVTGSISLTTSDTPTIDITASGTANHTIHADVKRSANANNAITEQSDGLHVLSPAISKIDTEEITITADSVHNHRIKANINLSLLDGDNLLTIEADGLYAKQRQINPTDSDTIDFTLSDAVNNIFTGDVIIDPDPLNILSATANGLMVSGSGFALSANSVTNTILRDSVANSVIGRGTGTTGDPADIVAGNNDVLRRSGSGNLAFGSLVTNNLGDDIVTFPKIQNISSSTVLGRTTGGSGDVEQLVPGSGIILSGGVINTIGRTLISITKFTSSGTWTKPTGCNAVLVYTTAGGGGGGGADASLSQAATGAGGGAGATIIHFLTAGLGATETVTIGAGGAGGDSGNVYAGQDGGDSTFGAHTEALGGIGGATLSTGTSVAGVQGGLGGSMGAPVTGLISGGAGQAGTSGMRFSLSTGLYGVGGSSFYGGSGSYSFGAGGNGNFDQNGSTEDGQDGGTGIIVVFEYS